MGPKMFVFINIPVILASLGIVLAATSFISGLQLVRGKSISVEGTIHRTNGYLTIILFIVLAVTAITGGGIGTASFLVPVAGLGIFMLKRWIIRKKKRLLKYVSWMGGSLILIWLAVYYIHIPA